MRFIKNEEELKDAVANMSINEANDKNGLKDAVENSGMKNKKDDLDVFSQLSTAPNSPDTKEQD